MGNTTVYDVVARLSMRDQGVRAAMTNVSKAAEEATKSTGRLQGVLARVGGIAAGVFTARAAYSGLITYNRGLEDTKNSLATIINLNEKGPWETSVAKGARLMEQFKEDAKTSAGTMKDMADFASTIINPVLQAGGTLDDLRTFTKQAVVAAASMGVSNEVAAMDMIQALRGTASAKDKMTMGLLGSVGMDNERFNDLSGKERFELMRKLLTSPALMNAAKQQGAGMTGLMSTTMDNLEQMLGTIGKGVFESLKGTFSEINTWIEKHQGDIKNFASELGATLKDAFQFAKSAFAFIIEHKDLLLNLAKAWLVGKAVGGIANAAVDSAKWIQGLTTGVGTFLGKVNLAVLALQAFAGATQFVASSLLDNQESRMDKDVTSGSFKRQLDAAMAGRGMQLYKTLQEYGAVDKSGRIDLRALRRNESTGAGSDLAGWISHLGVRNVEGAIGGAMTRSNAHQADMVILAATNALRIFKGALDDAVVAQKAADAQWAKWRDGTGFLGLGGFFRQWKPQINVNKLVIDVKTDDPDRLVMGIEGYFQDFVRHGTPPTSLRPG